ncbi:hypothetical protein TEQG_00888 [Trichophyton equinum CBS 127.97]|uniref:Uncharacterized protein n=1 Tax=Trichophyton equinum (strain ATCC MYA-4606 / CBS 127.97) TaxID=559882 RepID=F2PIX9_TRIEC|nr:hypothetical protein TEQG_00888 [Trichophyton equinum CBS 127.97]
MTKRREDREKRNESNPVLLPECEWPDELRRDAVACPWTYQNYEVQPPFPRAGAVFDAGLPVALFSKYGPTRGTEYFMYYSSVRGNGRDTALDMDIIDSIIPYETWLWSWYELLCILWKRWLVST